MMPSMMCVPVLPLPGPNVLAIPPLPSVPQNAQEGTSQPPGAPPDEPEGISAGPWCFGADSVCEWLGTTRLFGAFGPSTQRVCRVGMNILCLLLGLVLLVALTAVLIAAFLEPG